MFADIKQRINSNCEMHFGNFQIEKRKTNQAYKKEFDPAMF